jgi:hypothetical protein
MAIRAGALGEQAWGYREALGGMRPDVTQTGQRLRDAGP